MPRVHEFILSVHSHISKAIKQNLNFHGFSLADNALSFEVGVPGYTTHYAVVIGSTANLRQLENRVFDVVINVLLVPLVNASRFLP